MNLLNLKTRFGRIACASLGFVSTVCLSAAPKLNPVQWSLSAAKEPVSPGSTIVLRLHADIEPGYHLYSLTTPAGGPIQTTLSIQDTSLFDRVRVYQPQPNRHNDPNLNVPVETFSGPTDFLFEAKVKQDAAFASRPVTAQTRYQACSDEICLPPVERIATVVVAIGKGAPMSQVSVPRSYHLVGGPLSAANETDVISSMSRLPDFRFLLLTFSFGLAALFTPCVFPAVPLTISYFLHNGKNSRQAAMRQAFLFSVGILVLFSAIGVLATVIAVPFG